MCLSSSETFLPEPSSIPGLSPCRSEGDRACVVWSSCCLCEVEAILEGDKRDGKDKVIWITLHELASCSSTIYYGEVQSTNVSCVSANALDGLILHISKGFYVNCL